MSDTTESDPQRIPTLQKSSPGTCPSAHEGRQLADVELPLNVDTLFSLLFSGSRFLFDFHTSRKNRDIVFGDWNTDPSSGHTTRSVSLTVHLTQAVGPKVSYITETQVMLPGSHSGQCYFIDIDSVNAGIPYADSFYLAMHYCLVKTGDHKTRLVVYGQIVYTKSVWTLVKGFIEKNSWSGFEEFFDSLVKALRQECESNIVRPRKKIRRSANVSVPNQGLLEKSCRPKKERENQTQPTNIHSKDTFFLWGMLVMLIFLALLNGVLYYKLWSVEQQAAVRYTGMQLLKSPPQTKDEWLKILQRHESTHSIDLWKWQRVLQSAVQLLRQIETSMHDLQVAIHPVGAATAQYLQQSEL